jgi:hypothetical protein
VAVNDSTATLEALEAFLTPTYMYPTLEAAVATTEMVESSLAAMPAFFDVDVLLINPKPYVAVATVEAEAAAATTMFTFAVIVWSGCAVFPATVLAVEPLLYALTKTL